MIGIVFGIGLIVIRYYRRKRLYILIDTTFLQEQFEALFNIPAVKKGKFRKDYKQWLRKVNDRPSALKNVNQNPNLYLQQGTNKHILVNTNVKFDWYCFFVISFFLPMFFGIIYVSVLYWYISVPLFSVILLVFYFSRKKNSGQLLNYLDSEVKRDLFEIETGYRPTTKSDKISFKYRKWLIVKEFG